jgi:pseudouridine-5'-phosphate glycosidase
MDLSSLLDVRSEVASALRAGEPVVGLGSAPIAHNLPWPINLKAAQEAEAAVRQEGAIPATLGIWEGRPTVGLTASELEALARGASVFKASRRDLPKVIAAGHTTATSLGANLCLAHLAGIRFIVTGGVGRVGLPSTPPRRCPSRKSRPERCSF